MGNTLKNKVIVLTRSSDQAEYSIKKFESLGAKVISFPAIKIRPIKEFSMFDNYVEDFDRFDYIIFTSENAVKYSLQRLKLQNISLPEKIKLACTGKKTADKCKDEGLQIDIIPADYSAKGLLQYFSNEDIKTKKFFIPSSSIARAELQKGLLEQGAEVIQTPIYDVGLPDKNEIEKNKEKIKNTRPELFIFTSPSTYNNTLKILEIDEPKNYFEEFTVAAIGPTTKKAIEESGVLVDIIPDKYTMDDLLDSIVKFYSNKESINT